jgi:hypothetical protein
MVAKRNADVQKLNALAREVRLDAGNLGSQEIEVGEARFAAGDQVITRVNDHRAEIYNRERWRVESVDAECRSVGMVGVDSARRVVLDADYLGRMNPNDGSPALQHAYAATTYQAQGSTVDRAYVMADPSMDRQELYVAASRSREETWFYATPEVDLEREEYAPHSPGREGLAHIAAAAESDGSQVSAHDQALRSRFDGLTSPELTRLRRELSSEIGAEQAADEGLRALDARIARSEELLAGVDAERLALGDRPRRGREAKRAHDQALRHLDSRERMSRRALERYEAERDGLPRVGHEARAEVAAIDAVLGRQVDRALAAARVSPPEHVVAELGERPEQGRERLAWDRAVSEVEGYRQRNGIRSRETALGPEPREAATRMEHRRAQEAVRRAQRELGIERVRTIERTRAMEIEL